MIHTLVSARLLQDAERSHVHDARMQMDTDAGTRISSEILSPPIPYQARLKQQLQRMSERIVELEDQRREIETYTGWSYDEHLGRPPPGYAHVNSTDSTK